MVFIEKESYPAKGLGQKLLAIMTICVILFMSTTMVLNANTLRYEKNNLLISDTTAINDREKDSFEIKIAEIAKEKIQEYENVAEVESWEFDKDKFINSLGVASISTKTKDVVTEKDLKEKIKNCLTLTFNQYELKIAKDNTTFYFKSEKEVQEYKDKIKISAEISKATVKETKITSQADLDKKYAEITKPVTVAKTNTTKVTSRGGATRTTNSGYTGILPLSNYVYISSGYRTAKRPNHTGIDYAANYGTGIKAFQSGKVIKASWNGGYGKCIEVDHGNGMITRYAHCSSYNVSVGQNVSQGQIIGYVGSTGNSTGNHLHFEVIINGVFYNPLNYIK